MAVLQRLQIGGIRSFGPNEEDVQQIKFSTPLTLFLGQNGSGKTSIIEALKFACTGDLPSGSSNGQGFVNDPKISNLTSTKGQVRLQLLDDKSNTLTVFKSVQVIQKQTNMQFKRLDSTLKKVDASGKEATLSGRCGDIDEDICQALGVSKSIINNVIFCHQEDSCWPLDEGKKLKEKFDDIFDATKYNTCIENLRKIIKKRTDEEKILAERLNTLKEKKEVVERRRKQLEEKNEKLAQLEEDIMTKVESLDPIAAKIQEICDLQMDLQKLAEECAAKTSKRDGLKHQENQILKNITEEFEGTDQKLQQEIESFENNRNELKTKLNNYDLEKKEMVANEEALDKAITKEQVKIGQLKEEKRQYHNLLNERNKCLKDIMEKLSLEEASSLENDETVRSAIQSVESAIKTLKDSLQSLIQECHKKEQEYQNNVDVCKEKLISAKQNTQTKKEQLNNVQKKIREINNQLQMLDVSDKQLLNIDNKIVNIDKDMQDVKSSLDVPTVTASIEKDKKAIHQLQEDLQALEKDYKILQNNYVAECEMERLAMDIAERDVEISRLKNDQSFRQLFPEGAPEKNFQFAADKCRKSNATKVAEVSKKLQDKRTAVTKVDTQLKNEKSKLSGDVKELEENRKKILDVCGKKQFNETIEEVHQIIEKLQKDKGQYSSAKIMYEKFVQEFSAEEPCCPVCETGFSDKKQAVKVIVDKIKRKIQGIPNELKKVENELKNKHAQYDKLLQLKPVYEDIRNMESHKIPTQTARVADVEKQLEELRRDVSALEKEMKEPEQMVEICNLAIKGCIRIDEYQLENDKTRAKHTEAQQQLRQVPSNRTRQETEIKIDDIKEDVSKKQANCETLQKKLDRYKASIQDLSERKSTLVEKQLEIQKNIQGKPLFLDQLRELTAQEEQLNFEISCFVAELQPLAEQLKEAETSKHNNRKKDQEQVESVREECSVFEKKYAEIKKIQYNLKTLSEKDVEKKFNLAVDELTQLRENLKGVNNSKNEITEKETRLHVQLGNLNGVFRSLNDNVTLRSIRNEQTQLETEITKLKSKIGDHSARTISKEKLKLESKRSEIDAEINKMKGRKTELKMSVEELNQELKRPDYKQAFVAYKKLCFEANVNISLGKELKLFLQHLEYSLLEFHRERMTQINTSIRTLWRAIYKGNDCDYIEIKTEEASTKGAGTRRSYNYKVVQVKNGVELDMRGRCSAGQRVLASLIIRMALAETFSRKCGILALDEPTTNLDRENIISLGETLATIIDSHQGEKNFQLLVITHDKQFLNVLRDVSSFNHYWKVRRNDRGNTTVVKEKL